MVQEHVFVITHTPYNNYVMVVRQAFDKWPSCSTTGKQKIKSLRRDCKPIQLS